MSENQIIKIEVATNYNKKLDCDFFIHIGPMPPKPTDENVSYYKMMLGRMCEFRCRDNSHAPVQCQIIDWLAEYKVKNVPEIFILQSHGKRRAEWQSGFLKEFIQLNQESPVGIFYFKRV